jgi:hypothetical protein
LRLAAALLVATGAAGATGCETRAADPATPDYGDAFWRHWGDGSAELAGYRLSYPRYGSERDGTAVTIFVTESFAESARVKAEDSARDAADVFPVLKLNLIQDFATGIYDYNLMTSAFVGLAEAGGRPAGTPTKISFSSQEWCGQAYSQLLFDAEGVRHTLHSYFDGEADREETLERPAGGVAEDTLLIWARGLAAPKLEPGESRDVPLLRSVEFSRMRHLPAVWTRARLSRAGEPRTVTVPAGEFVVDVLEANVEAQRIEGSYPPGTSRSVPPLGWTFFVEAAPPHRLVRWTRDDGLDAELLGSTRTRYWAENGPGLERELERLGLSPRPPRTP